MRRLGFALGSVALGGLIGAIQYLPVVEYTPPMTRTAFAVSSVSLIT